MKPANLYQFENEMRTEKEIRAICPLLKSHHAVKMAIAAGRNTIRAVATYNPDVARRAGGRHGAAVVKRMGFDSIRFGARG